MVTEREQNEPNVDLMNPLTPETNAAIKESSDPDGANEVCDLCEFLEQDRNRWKELAIKEVSKSRELAEQLLTTTECLRFSEHTVEQLQKQISSSDYWESQCISIYHQYNDWKHQALKIVPMAVDAAVEQANPDPQFYAQWLLDLEKLESRHQDPPNQ
jgi:hypothetical protein